MSFTPYPVVINELTSGKQFVSEEELKKKKQTHISQDLPFWLRAVRKLTAFSLSLSLSVLFTPLCLLLVHVSSLKAFGKGRV